MIDIDITDELLIKEILKDRYDNCSVDSACIKRIKILADDYGENGKRAKDLLKIVMELLDIY